MEKLIDFLNTISYRNYTFQKPEFEIKLKRPIFTKPGINVLSPKEIKKIGDETLKQTIENNNYTICKYITLKESV